MAEAAKQAKPSLGTTLWSALMLVCVLLVVAHLVQAVNTETVSEEELINSTFTAAGSDSAR